MEGSTKTVAYGFLAALAVYVAYGTCQTGLFEMFGLHQTHVRTGTTTAHLSSWCIGARPQSQFYLEGLSVAAGGDPVGLVLGVCAARVHRAGPVILAAPVAADLWWWLPTMLSLVVAHCVASWWLPVVARKRASQWISERARWVSLPADARERMVRGGVVSARLAHLTLAGPVGMAMWFVAYSPAPLPNEIADELFPGPVAGPVSALLLFALAAATGSVVVRLRMRTHPNRAPKSERCACGYPLLGLAGIVCPECGSDTRRRRRPLRLPVLHTRILLWLAAGAAGTVCLLIWAEGAIMPSWSVPAILRLNAYSLRAGLLLGPCISAQNAYWRYEAPPATIRWPGRGTGVVACRAVTLNDDQMEVHFVWGWCPTGRAMSDPAQWALHSSRSRLPQGTYVDARFLPRGAPDSPSNPRLELILQNQSHNYAECVLHGRPDEIRPLSDQPELERLWERVRTLLEVP